MREQDDIVQFHEGVVGGQGFFVKDVKSAAADLFIPECFNDRILVGYSRASGVDEKGILLHQADLGSTDHSPVGLAGHDVDGDEIRFLHESVEVDFSRLVFGHDLVGDVRVVSDQLTAEG